MIGKKTATKDETGGIVPQGRYIEPVRNTKKDLMKALEKEGAEIIDCNSGFKLSMDNGPTLQYVGDFKIILVRNE